MLAFYEFTDYSFHIVVVFNVSYIYIYIYIYIVNYVKIRKIS